MILRRLCAILPLAAVVACAPAVESVAGEPEGPPSPALVEDPLPELLSRPPVSSATEEDALRQLAEAIEHWESGRRADGVALADAALARLPALEDWRPILIAELLAPTGDTSGVRAALSSLDASTELQRRWGWRFLADAHEAAGDRSGAARVARAYAAAESGPGLAADQWVRAGQAALASGDTIRAREDLREALSRGGSHPGALLAARLLDPIAGPLPPRESAELGRSLVAAGAWEAGRRRLSPLLTDPALPVELRDELRLDLGRALLGLRLHAEVEATLAPLTTEGTAAGLLRPALLWSALAALERGQMARAEGHVRRLAAAAPGSAEAEEGLHLLLTHELRTGFGPRARGFLDELLASGVRSAPVETTVTQLGTTLYLDGDLVGAADLFDRFLEGGLRPAGRQQAAYWAGLAHERAGNPALARERWTRARMEDPLSVYGGFAGGRVGAEVLPLTLVPGPTPLPGLDRELSNALLRLRVHRIVPTPGSLAWEVERLTEHFRHRGNGLYDFAEALVDGGFPLQAIVLGRDLHRVEGEWNLRLLRIVHPLPHGEILLREAAARGLDPFLVAGLIRQESAWDRRIVSSAGAVGLMQLMPATAREVAGSLGVTLGPGALEDPEVNIRLGTTYLRSMLQRFDGRVEDALAAYNAGPGRMNQWRANAYYRDRDVFMEHIPFQETRGYVRTVQQYTRIYTALYGCGHLEPCLGLSYPEAANRSGHLTGYPTLGPAR